MGHLGVGGMNFLLRCVPTNQVYCSGFFILADMHVLTDAGLMAQSSVAGD